MPAVVQIEVRLDDKGVVTGVQNITEGLRKTGQKGNVVFTEMSKQQRLAEVGFQNLARQVGVEMPRSIEKLIVKNETLTKIFSSQAVIGAATYAAIGIAIISTFPAIAKMIDNLRGITEELDKQKQTAIEINVKLLGEQSVQDLGQSIASVTAEQRQLEAATDSIGPALGRVAASVAAGIPDLDAMNKLNQQIESRYVHIGGVVLPILSDEYKANRDRLADVNAQLERMAVLQAMAFGKTQTKLPAGFFPTKDQWQEATAEASKFASQEEQRKAKRKQIEDAIFKARLDGMRDSEKQQMESNKRLLDDAIQNGEQEIAHLARVSDASQAIIDAEREGAITRAQLNGDAIGAMKLQEQDRVDDAIAKIHALVLAEKEGSDARQALQAQEDQLRLSLGDTMNAKILLAERDRNQQVLQQNQQMVQQLAGEMESLWDDIWSGNIAKKALQMIKHFFFQILAQWLLTLGGMRSAGAGVGGGGGGGGLLGSLLGGLFGLGGGGGGGGLFGGVAPTPPFFGALSGGGAGFNIAGALSPSSLGGMEFTGGSFTQPLAAGLPSAGLGLGGALPGLGGAAAPGQAFSLAGLLGGLPGLLGTLGLPLAISGITSGNLVTGGIGGAFSGFGIGAALFGAGPIGAVIGAVVGIIGAIIGRKKRAAKAFHDTQQIWFEAKKQIDDIKKAYMDHQLGFDDALGQLDDLRNQTADALIQASAQDRNSKWGRRYIQKRLDPAVADAKEAIKQIEQQRQARGSTTFGPAQFHSGGFTGAGAGEFNARLLRGEFVVNPMATSQHRALLEAINGSSRIRQAGVMLSSPPRFHAGGFAAPQAAAAPMVNIYAIDSADVADWLRNRGGLREIRRAWWQDDRERG